MGFPVCVPVPVCIKFNSDTIAILLCAIMHAVYKYNPQLKRPNRKYNSVGMHCTVCVICA